MKVEKIYHHKEYIWGIFVHLFTHVILYSKAEIFSLNIAVVI
jgi:hypothetical protein